MPHVYSGEKEIIFDSERIEKYFMEDMDYNITNKNNNDYHLKYFTLRFSSGKYHDMPKNDHHSFDLRDSRSR